MADIRELYSARVEAARIALGRGDRLEAERLFSESLAIGEENFGANDPVLTVPLNELSRLYVRRAEHARAEPLLQRLLDIRSASGANHPDVATVLAALAAVRRGLGDDAAAEPLYRQALEIREQVHAPDHMSVVVTVEQLADTCAALRKIAEASALFERALAVREKALGPNHQSVRTLRERLTALAATNAAPVRPDSSRPVPVAPPAPAPEQAPITNELVFLYEPEKPVRRASVRRDRVMTPPFSAAVAAASLITVPAHASPPARESAPMELSTASLVMPDPRELDAAMKPRLDDDHVPRETVPRRSQRIEAPLRAEALADRRTNRVKRYGLTAGGLAVLASAAFVVSSRLPHRTTTEPSPLAPASQPVASVTRTPAAAAAVVSASARLATARKDSARLAIAKQARATATMASAPSDPQAEKGVAVADLPSLPVLGSVVVPETNAPNADSLLRAATTRHDVDTNQIGSVGGLRTLSLSEDRGETSPVLVGVVPQPRFPDALRAQRIEGAVVVQFLVGVDGNVDASSMKVVRSPHELFTAAVRSVLPKLHFQPARSSDAKPRAEWVQYSIEFRATK